MTRMSFGVRCAFLVSSSILCSLSSVFCPPSSAQWTGHPSDPTLHAWFDRLASGKGLCCSFADGVSLSDPDWGTERVATAQSYVIRYWVAIDGQKIIVPPEAVVTVPNRFGQAVVWPYRDETGKTQIRCFMPGAGT